jgi:hypothetical protein
LLESNRSQASQVVRFAVLCLIAKRRSRRKFDSNILIKCDSKLVTPSLYARTGAEISYG